MEKSTPWPQGFDYNYGVHWSEGVFYSHWPKMIFISFPSNNAYRFKLKA